MHMIVTRTQAYRLMRLYLVYMPKVHRKTQEAEYKGEPPDAGR